MPEQSAFVRLSEHGTSPELANTSDVVHERGREQQIVPQALVQLCGLAAQRRDPDRVLEQAACIRVMAVDRRRQRAQSGAGPRVERALDGGV